MCAEHSQEEIVVGFDLATARKRKTITIHITGDSEVERTARKINSAPSADGENDDILHER
jgi:hypothetical protein